MVQLEKILCFLFTLFVIYLVDKQCKIEGVTNLDAFDSCNDDPDWYTLGEGGKKFRCSDIGENASCYDLDERQQEGWERCLKTCGNCAKTKVTEAPQDNLAIYSGETGGLYGKAGEIDDSRKFVGLGIGDENNKDVRSTITSDQGEDILDISDRLNVVEELYDMLLGSVSSCIDCNKYTSQPSCVSHGACQWSSGNCRTKTPNPRGSNKYFKSCKGSELSCEYTIEQRNPLTGSTAPQPSPQTTGSTQGTGSTQQVNGNTVPHTYVRHECNDDGDCSLMFPTYEFKCDNIPQPQSAMEKYHRITYQPRGLTPKKCLSEYYINTNDTEIHTMKQLIDEISREILIVNQNTRGIASTIQTTTFGTINTNIDSLRTQIDNLKNSISSNPVDSVTTNLNNVKTKTTEIIINIDTIIPSLSALPLVLSGINDIKNKVRGIKFRSIKIIDRIGLTSNQNIFNNNATTNNITPSIQGHECRENITDIRPFLISTIAPAPSPAPQPTTKINLQRNNFYIDDRVTITDITLTSPNSICSTMNNQNLQVKEVDQSNPPTFITLKNNTNPSQEVDVGSLNGRCNISRTGETFIKPKCYQLDTNQIGTNNSSSEIHTSCASVCNSHNENTGYIATNSNGECYCFKTNPTGQDITSPTNNTCPSNTLEALVEGRVVSTENIRVANVDPDEEMRKMCKSYFLLEKSLTGEDMGNNTAPPTGGVTGTTDRISLYDMCPTQCKAQGC